MSSSRDRNISGYPDLGDFQIFRAEVINNNDEHQKSRVQCRMIGHETDLINMPDDEMQWYSIMTPETSHRGMGYNPRYVPGDQVYCLQFGNERIILGSVRKEDPYEGDEADVNPWTLDGSSSPKSPPDETNDRKKGWQEGVRSEEIKKREDKTEYSRKSKRKREVSKKEQGESKSKNVYERTENRFGKKLSIGKDIPFDNNKNPMQFIQNRIQNDGAVVPEMLKMVEQLRKQKSEEENPPAIQAVGAGNYASFISSIAKYFSDLKNLQQKKEDEQDEERRQEEEQDQNDLQEALALIENPFVPNTSIPTAASPDSTVVIDTTSYVVKSGNVADNQIPVFVSDGAVEGNTNLTYDGTTLEMQGRPLFTQHIHDTSLARNFFGSFGYAGLMQTNGNNDYGMGFSAVGNHIYALWNTWFKTRSTDGSTRAIVVANDELLRLNCLADDGTAWRDGGTIRYRVDGTPSVGNVGSKLEFSTANGSGAIAALTIDRSQDATFYGDVTIDSVFTISTANTVANLPGTPTTGMVARVNDANAPAVGSIVAGSGAAEALVWYNGSNWTVIGV